MITGFDDPWLRHLSKKKSNFNIESFIKSTSFTASGLNCESVGCLDIDHSDENEDVRTRSTVCRIL